MKKTIYLLSMASALVTGVSSSAQTNVQALTYKVQIDTLGDTTNIELYSYNPVGLQTLRDRQGFNAGTLTYRNKDTFTYDSNDLLREKLMLNYNISNQAWDSTGRMTYVQYDADGKILEDIYEYYNTNTGWTNSQRYLYTYNSDGTLAESMLFSYTGGQWDTLRKTEYSYNSNGSKTMALALNWNSNTSQYDSLGMDMYTYNSAQTRLIEYQYKYYNAGAWIPASKDSLFYTTGSDQAVTKESYYWDTSSNTWVPSAKEGFYYNNGILFSNTNIPYDQQSQAWATTPSDSTLAFHDASVTRGELLLPKNVLNNGFFNRYFDLKIDSLRFFNGAPLTHASTWVMTYTPMTITGSVPTDIDENENLKVALFPNPTTDIINVLFEKETQDFEVEVFTLSGKRVLSRRNIYSVSLQHLVPGSYFYKVTSGNDIKTGIVVKQ